MSQGFKILFRSAAMPKKVRREFFLVFFNLKTQGQISEKRGVEKYCSCEKGYQF